MRKWGNRRSLQLLQSIQEVGIIWNPFLDVLDDAIFADNGSIEHEGHRGGPQSGTGPDDR